MTADALAKLKSKDDASQEDKPAAEEAPEPEVSKDKEEPTKEEPASAPDDDDDDDDDSAEVEEAADPGPQMPAELKEFGRLSTKSAVEPKLEGKSVGTMKTVGKLLLDHEAVEQIIKTGEEKKRLGKDLATARIISANRGAGITELLNKIDSYDDVSGSLIVGHDGLVMASTVEGEYNKDILGALSTALLSTSNLSTKKLEIGKLRQMVLLTDLAGVSKTTVLTDVDVGILAVFVETTDVTKIDGLLDTIHKTIHGG